MLKVQAGRPESYILSGQEVKAWQVNSENITRISNWCRGEAVLRWVEPENPDSKYMDIFYGVSVRTSDGRTTEAECGDWIVQSQHGKRVLSDKEFKTLAKRHEDVAGPRKGSTAAHTSHIFKKGNK